MKTAIVVPALCLCAAALPAHGALTDFEHVPGAYDHAPLSQVAQGYGGVNWGADFFLKKSNSWNGGAHALGRLGNWVLASTASENWIMPNIGGNSYSFDFTGGDFASLSQGGTTFTLVGYRSGAQTWSQQIHVGTNPQYFAFNWKNTNGVVIYVNDGDQLILDNLRLSPLATSRMLAPAIPEPETYALMGLGLASLLLRRRLRSPAFPHPAR
ncbi:PEP-CTERM sorting domain-containing protein [Paludibacterium paludis]|uniref:Ice-binding protein C-terminal domain-containing protein n=1 Tax=Paludibacterium paludis TaxID=1225769 RepID=A0A918NX98_9NEIS|nr:PEP-CTERM sorting domain-containing protein [Paludibacterium paludis]GGY04014.1 hypothetical protein GCM10011289_03000 [Paludibacterium paludis]